MNIIYSNQQLWDSAMQNRQERMKLASGNIDMLLDVRQSAHLDGTSWVIDIFGPLSDGRGKINELLGGTNYSTILQEIVSAPENCDEIIFIVDSPGGDAQGVYELAELIRNLPVPTIAYIRGMCCSAAYFLASACGQIISTPSGTIGSIGTMLTIRQDPDGVEIITNDDARLKHPATPLDAESKTYYQNLCNTLAHQFQQFVRLQRHRLDPDVFTGKIYPAESAVQAGLIDSVYPWVFLGESTATISY